VLVTVLRDIFFLASNFPKTPSSCHVIMLFLCRNDTWTLNYRHFFLQETVQSLVKQHMPKKVGDKLLCLEKMSC